MGDNAAGGSRTLIRQSGLRPERSASASSATAAINAIMFSHRNFNNYVVRPFKVALSEVNPVRSLYPVKNFISNGTSQRCGIRLRQITSNEVKTSHYIT